jgi:hypothetical protein
MHNISDDRGRYLALPNSRSFHRIPSVPAVAVVSGNLLRQVADLDRFCMELDAPTVEAAAGHLYREVEKDDVFLQMTWPAYTELKLDTVASPQVLVVGGRDRESLRVGVVTPNTHQWISWPETAFAAVGAWTPFLAGHPSMPIVSRPTTLADWLEIAAGWARDYIATIYAGRTLEQMATSGVNPTCGFPARVWTVDEAGTVREYEITATEIFELEVTRD